VGNLFIQCATLCGYWEQVAEALMLRSFDYIGAQSREEKQISLLSP